MNLTILFQYSAGVPIIGVVCYQQRINATLVYFGVAGVQNMESSVVFLGKMNCLFALDFLLTSLAWLYATASKM